MRQFPAGRVKDLGEGRRMIKKYTLLRSQRNRVFEILREVGLEPALFTWAKEEVANAIVVSRLKYRQGDFFFQFSWYEMSAWCMCSPGRFRASEYNHPKDWAEQEGFFRNWAHYLKRETEAPDLWDDLAKYAIVVAPEFHGELINEPIPAGEAEKIAEALQAVCRTLQTESARTPDEVRLVREKCTYLADATKRLRSADWVHTAIGTCVTLAMAMEMSQDRAGRLWQLVESHLGQFVRLTTS
jgi:hypothetical protein